MSEDHDIIDALLHALVEKGEGSFDVFNELLYLKGPDYANRMHVFFERSLEYHKLANRTKAQNNQFALTGHGINVSKKGGWNKYLLWKEDQARTEYEAQVQSKRKEGRTQDDSIEAEIKQKVDFTMTVAVVAIALAFVALIFSVIAVTS